MRKHWLAHWETRAWVAFDRLGEGASELERLETAMDLLWSLARRVFLMHRVDDMPFREISEHLGIDGRTIEICISDALRVVAAAQRDEHW